MDNDLAKMLQGVQTLWEKQIQLCKEAKERDFSRSAAEIMCDVGKRYKRIALEPKIDATRESMGSDDPEFTAIYNMTDAYVSVMTPYVFSQVHDFLVTPRRPQMPPEFGLAGAADRRPAGDRAAARYDDMLPAPVVPQLLPKTLRHGA